MKHWFTTDHFFCANFASFFLKILCVRQDRNIPEVSVIFRNILELPGTFQNIEGLIIRDKNHSTNASEVSNNSFLLTVHVNCC